MSQSGGYQFPDFGSPGGGDDPYARGEGQGKDAYGQAGAGEFQEPYADPYGGSASVASSPAYQSDQAGHADQSGQSGFAPQPAVGAGAYGQGYMPGPPSSGMAIAGMVLGIASIAFCAGFTAPFGLVFSILGMKETAPSAASPKGGRGLAIAGLVTSIIGSLILLLWVAYVLLIIVGVGMSSTRY